MTSKVKSSKSVAKSTVSKKSKTVSVSLPKPQSHSVQKTSPIPKKPAKEPQTMDELMAMTGGIKVALKRGDTIEGTIVSKSGKEILIDIGKKSFGVVTEWELSQVKDYVAGLSIGGSVTAQVVNPENDFGYVVLSLRRSSSERRWERLIAAKEDGSDLEVTALEVAKGGLLVDWQGLRGFIPSTQLEGASAISPHQLIGKKLKVKVLEVDRAVNRLVLSQRASVLGVTPAHVREKMSKVKPNDILKGKVSGVATFGVFVDVDGLEGLVHISEIAWEKVDNPNNMFKVNDTVEVVVLDVNVGEGKLNLSIKRLTPDPWKNILDRYPIESTLKGKVVRSAPYGYFVHLETGIEGLLHISKVTAGEEPTVGQELECVVENIDVARRKMSLTLVPKAKPVGYR